MAVPAALAPAPTTEDMSLRFLTTWLLAFALVCSGVARVRVVRMQTGSGCATSCCCAPVATGCCADGQAATCGCGRQAPEPEPTSPNPQAPRMPDLGAQGREPVQLPVLVTETRPAPRSAPANDPVRAHARPRQAELRTFLI